MTFCRNTGWQSLRRIGFILCLISLSYMAAVIVWRRSDTRVVRTEAGNEPPRLPVKTAGGKSPPRVLAEKNEMAPYTARLIENRTFPNTSWFEDSLMWGTRKPNKGYLTIGIPCLVRPRKDRYIVRTLNLLIRHSSEADRKEMTIVIFMADLDEKIRHDAGLFLYKKYKSFVDVGFIQIIKAPPSFYPTFDGLQKYASDPIAKVKWHSKQNFDYGFIMLYSQSLAEYYLQLEDDVVTVPNYFRIIKDFVSSLKKRWVCLEFCELGFIAKLYHSYHLEKLAQLLMLFYNEHPNDVLYWRFSEMMFQPKRIFHRPSIFDHIGLHSSMKLKMNSLRDLNFKAKPEDIEDNDPDIKGEITPNNYPPAKLSCTVAQYDKYTPEKFYTGVEDAFFAREARNGDTFSIAFDQLQRLSHVYIRTGHSLYPDDYIYNGELRVGKAADISNPKKLGCSSIISSAAFQNGEATISDISQHIPVACVQIVITKSQNHWLLITNMTLLFHNS